MGDVILPKRSPRPRGKPFEKGQSGNPIGRALGARGKASLIAEMLLDGEAEALTRKAVELALAGDPFALRLCLDRILAPRSERAVRFDLPSLCCAADIAPAFAAVSEALASGEITPGEAAAIAQVIDSFTRTIDISDLGWRLEIAEGLNAAHSLGLD